MNKLKSYIIILLVSLLTLSLGLHTLHQKELESVKTELNYTLANYKAYESLYNQSEEENRVFQLTIDQLIYTKDSLTSKLGTFVQENKALKSRVKSLAYLESQAHIADTIVVKDTIFVEDTRIDTSIINKWYNFNLQLSYPNEINFDMKVNSEKYIMVSSKKETIMPPKKCLLIRMFQRKHTILEVDVVEKNPYIINNQQRFVEIIDN